MRTPVRIASTAGPVIVVDHERPAQDDHAGRLCVGDVEAAVGQGPS
jgi:hypothetical protein